MKTILICPNQAHGITVLADARPLPLLPILGEAFICYWMHHLAAQKFREVRIITGEPAELISQYTGDGSRWGLKVEIYHEVYDLAADEARRRYKDNYEGDWAPEPLDVIHANHLPGLPEEKLFTSYEHWFRTLLSFVPLVMAGTRLGMREVSPGVWVGRRSKISRSARLVGPCWLGDHVQVGNNATVGPNCFLEDQVVVDSDCCVENSWVGPKTFLGSLAELKHSLAWGSLLINWKNGSHIWVPDTFLMSSLSEQKEPEDVLMEQPIKHVSQPVLARRFGTVISLAQKLQG
jgi:hypothetical protein